VIPGPETALPGVLGVRGTPDTPQRMATEKTSSFHHFSVAIL